MPPAGSSSLARLGAADQSDVRRIALSLPEVVERTDKFAFSVLGKVIASVWQERVEPKKPRVPRPAVLVVRVANLREKEALLAVDPANFFTEPHYNGFPGAWFASPPSPTSFASC